jgi:membrane-associated protein
MLVGFFLPGDTLLVSAGILAAQGKLPIIWTIAVIAVAGMLGDNFGYAIGRKIGPKILERPNGKIYRKSYMTKAVVFYQRHGRKSMLLAHFVPYVRTFAPIVAGVAGMNRKQYVIFDAIGVIAWASGITLVGFFVGSKIPSIEHYIPFTLLAVVVIAFGPAVHHIIRNYYRSSKRKLHAVESKQPLNLDEE